jgi:hypothetical protein
LGLSVRWGMDLLFTILMVDSVISSFHVVYTSCDVVRLTWVGAVFA